MSLLVFDSSAASKWYLPEIYADKAKKPCDEYRKGVSTSSPLISSLSRHFTPSRKPSDKSGSRWEPPTPSGNRSRSILPCSIPTFPSLIAYEIASAARIGIYDCIYVALAEREGCDFATADDRIIKNLQVEGGERQQNGRTMLSQLQQPVDRRQRLRRVTAKIHGRTHTQYSRWIPPPQRVQSHHLLMACRSSPQSRTPGLRQAQASFISLGEWSCIANAPPGSR
jgi:PIN domain